MTSGWSLKCPIFEVGLKGYLYGAAAVQLAREADRMAQQYGVTVIFDPQCVDIAAIARQTTHLHVFAQHMDPVEIGRGAGSVLPEAVKDAGATGTMLNHCERPLTLSQISRTMSRARHLGLRTMVCVDSPEEAAAVAQLGPDIILAEPPDLIGASRSVAKEMAPFVNSVLRLVSQVDPGIRVMCSAGIKTPEDVTAMVRLGVGATGSSSGILRAPDPVAAMDQMIRAMSDAWRAIHGDAATNTVRNTLPQP